MDNYLLIPFLPLVAFFINIIFGKKVTRDHAHWVSTLAVLSSWVISLMTLADVIEGKTLNRRRLNQEAQW